MTRQLAICAALCSLALATPLHAASSSAQSLVHRALAAMGYHRDLHRIATIRSTGVSTRRDIVEFDHPDAPYIFGGAARVALTDDLLRDRRLIQEQVIAASGPESKQRRILTPDVEQVESISLDGHTTRIVQEAPPSWQTDEPIRTLLLAERAGDLEQEPDSLLHGIPQHVLHFHHGRYPVRVFLDAVTDLPSAIETRIALHRAISSDIDWNAWGDLVDRIELMNYVLIEGVRYPAQSD
ncbi:MAG TPA: hypothetical protein VF216_06845, partial [Mizugakiibacter sp.]